MRPLKMVGLVALTITTSAASVGASTATATRLCSTSTAPCGSIYANNTSFTTHAFGGSLVITTSGSPVGVNPTLSCTSTLLQFQNTNQGGGAGVPVAGKVPTWTLSGCTSSNPSTCEPRGTPGSADTATGTIAFLAGASGTLQVRLQSQSFTCPILGATVQCTFAGGSGSIDAIVTGGNPAIIDVVNQPLAATGGFGCPTASTLNVRYQTTSPLYITNS